MLRDGARVHAEREHALLPATECPRELSLSFLQDGEEGENLPHQRGPLLARVAIGILAMRLVDLIWLVAPSFEHHGFPIHWMDLAIPVGLVGLWVFLFVRQLRSRPLLPLNDPFFKEAFAHDVH